MATTTRRLLPLTLAALLLLAAPGGALGDPGVLGDPDVPTRQDVAEAEEQASDLEASAAAAEAELAALEQEAAAIDAELVRVSDLLADAEAAARSAQAAADAASAEVARAQAALAEARDDLADNRTRLEDLVRQAYKRGLPASVPVLTALQGLSNLQDPNELADALHMVEVVADDRARVVEDSVRLLQRTEGLARVAEDAEQRRRDEAAAAEASLDEVASRHAEVMAVTERLDAATRRQHDLVAQLAEERAAARDEVEDLREAVRQAEEAERRAEERRRAEEARRAEEERRAAAEGGAADPGGDGDGSQRAGELVTVGGITVAASLGPALGDLLDAASADGIVLGGFGYRSPETTARLRTINGCPDVDESPASSCRVPTARPGESMHEQGLAVDFTFQGRTICYPRPASACSGNVAFDWLTANAHRYGLQVLSTEAWHWSTNGQ